jgi:hypothetical protein
MKLKISQVAEGFQVLSRIGNEKMPIKLAFTIQRNIRLMLPEFTDWEKKRTELIKEKYGIEDDKGNYTVPSDKIPEFTDEMVALGNVEIELDLHKISMTEFPLEISPIDLMVLEWLFEDNIP